MKRIFEEYIEFIMEEGEAMKEETMKIILKILGESKERFNTTQFRNVAKLKENYLKSYEITERRITIDMKQTK